MTTKTQRFYTEYVAGVKGNHVGPGQRNDLCEPIRAAKIPDLTQRAARGEPLFPQRRDRDIE